MAVVLKFCMLSCCSLSYIFFCLKAFDGAILAFLGATSHIFLWYGRYLILSFIF